MIVFFLVMRPVFCVAPEMLYYWYSRNPRMLDVLPTEPFLPPLDNLSVVDGRNLPIG